MKPGLLTRISALFMGVVLLWACDRTGPQGTLAGSEVRPPPFADGFTPPPSLPAPPAPEPGKLGLLYLQQLYGRIGEPWQTFIEDCRLRLPPGHALNESTLEAHLDVRIDKQGKLRGVALQRRSGNADFDAAALEIVRDAAPFPEPPYHLVSDDERVHVSWLFARDHRQAGMATAEIRLVEWPVARAVPTFLARGDVTTAAERLAQAAQAAGEGRGLAELGRELAVGAIREALRSPEPAAQKLGAQAAASARLLATAPELRILVDTSMEASVRGEAIAAVGAIGDSGAAQLLVGVLETARGSGVGGRADSSIAAARALAAIGQKEVAESTVQRWLEAGDDESLWAALIVMSELPVPDALPAVSALLERRGLARQVRQAACAAVGVSTTRGTASAGMRALYQRFTEPDAAVRAACARAVARAARAGVRSRLTYWKVIELIKKDRDERVRAAAVLAAAHLEPGRFHQELYLLHRETSPLVLVALAEGLAAVPGAAAHTRLAALAAHEDPAVRRQAATSLLARKDEPARKALAGLLRDPDARVRVIATRAIVDVATLRALLEDESAEVRAAAFKALVGVRGRAATLLEMARGIAGTRPGSAERAQWAMAWLLS